jgi:hypothetical protein
VINVKKIKEIGMTNQRLCIRIDGAYWLDRSAEILFSELGFHAPGEKSQNSFFLLKI